MNSHLEEQENYFIAIKYNSVLGMGLGNTL